MFFLMNLEWKLVTRGEAYIGGNNPHHGCKDQDYKIEQRE